jgi:CheY-like chemotaxis protein
MAHGFVQQSRGRLEIESDPGNGALIRLIFPAVSEAVERSVSRLAAASPSPVHSDPAPVNGARILLVEDNLEVQALGKEILSDAGYRVTTASSGDEGLAVFMAAPDAFDLLFSDIVMPGGRNGIVLAEHARRLRPDLPVLLTTGYNEDLLAEGPARPSLDVVGKPYRRAELLDRVRQALAKRAPEVRRTPSDFGSAEA